MKAILTILLIIISIYSSQSAYSEELDQIKDIIPPEDNITQSLDSEKIIDNNLQPDNTLQPVVPEQPKVQAEITLDCPKDQIPITLEKSIQTALENNYGIKIISTQQTRDKWLYYNDLSDFLPDVSFNYTQTRFGGAFLVGGVVPVDVTSTNINTGFAAQWDGFTGLRRYFNTRASRAIYNASKKNLELTQDQVLLLSTKQYYTLLQDKLNIEILKVALEQTQAQLRINQQRFEAGVGTRFDILRAEAEVASAEQNLIAAYNRLRLSQAQLANTLGINIFTPLVPAEEEVEPKTLFKDCFDLTEVTQIAIKNKPELDIAELNIAATRARRNSVYSIYLPTVSVRSTVNLTGREITDLNQNQSVALLVSWLGGENLGLEGLTSVKALNAQVEEAKLRLVDTTRNLEQSIVNSFYDIITARELIAATRAETVSAQESLRLAVIRLEEGVGIYTDVIAAQLTETQARIKYLNAIIGYNTSQAQLLFDMGVISPNNLLQGYTEEEATSDIKK
ncbi:MAG: hypothetical protein A2104_02965 [Candidatus Melainabacteria bacterium GWF2_32_7]|nr:MAG: hypothetical protein A2104_02965 [Candidatus Melainabacteria bacterium GWF2_32_7]